MSKRSLILANAGFRMAYGIGGLLSPAVMGKLQLAADTPERPDARLFVRGFSAHQIGVAALGLASLRWRQLERPAALAAVAIDVADMLSAAVEVGKREELGSDLTGGLVFSAAGVVTASAALRLPEQAARSAAVLPDILEPGLRVVFCGTAAGAASARARAYYAGPGNSFWAANLAFNGKNAARGALERRVDYGLQPERIGGAAVWVLPSTSGAARRFWDIEPWRELAESPVGSQAMSASRSQQANLGATDPVTGARSVGQ